MNLNQNGNIQSNKDAIISSKFHMTQSVHLEVVIAARIKPKCYKKIVFFSSSLVSRKKSLKSLTKVKQQWSYLMRNEEGKITRQNEFKKGLGNEFLLILERLFWKIPSNHLTVASFSVATNFPLCIIFDKIGGERRRALRLHMTELRTHPLWVKAEVQMEAHPHTTPNEIPEPTNAGDILEIPSTPEKNQK